MSSNPNNCPNCDHHKMQRDIEASDETAMKLHCYMFKDEPTEQCMQHTGHKMNFFSGGSNFPIQTAIHEMMDTLKRSGYVPDDLQ